MSSAVAPDDRIIGDGDGCVWILSCREGARVAGSVFFSFIESQREIAGVCVKVAGTGNVIVGRRR